MVMQMKKKSQRISDNLKAEIIEASRIPGCIVSEVAKNYNISPNLLYAWRSNKCKSNQPEAVAEAKINESNFVELSLDKAIIQSSSLFLKKVSLELEFDEFSFELQGNVSSKKLVKLITMLEESC